MEGKTKFSNIGFFPLLSSLPIVESFTRPTLAVRAQKSDIPALNGYGMLQTANNEGHLTGSPNYSEFKAIMGIGIEMTRTGPGAIQHDAYFAFFVLSAIAGGFLHISNLEETSLDNLAVHTTTPWMEIGDGNNVDIMYSGSRGKIVSVDVPEVAPSASGRWSIAPGKTIPIFAPVSKYTTISYAPYKKGSLRGFKAEERGAFFKYFPGILEPDNTFMAQIVQDKFFSMLGGSVETACGVMQIIRTGTKALVHCRGGEELSHFFMGIRLCMQARGRLQLVSRKGEYKGFILHGEFDFILRGKKVPLAISTAVEEAVESLGDHEKGLKTLSSLLAAKVLDDGSRKYVMDTQAIKTSYDLTAFFQTVDVNDFDATDRTAINGALDRLDFGEVRYLDSSLPNIFKFLAYIRDGDLTIFRGSSSFFCDGHIFKNGRISVGLSFFGKFVPSINYGRGKGVQSFQIPFRSEAVDDNLVVVDGKRRLPYIPFKRFVISEAIQDWNKLLSTGNLRLPPAKVDSATKRVTDFVDSRLREGVYGGAAFPGLYKDIRDTYVVCGREDPKGKRKAVDETGEGSKSKKGKAARDETKKISNSMMF